MRRSRNLLWFSAGALAFLITCELLLRVLPVSTATRTGYYIDPLIVTALPNHTFRTATGWDLRNTQTVHANNLGFAAAGDFKRDERAVALIGDSFVEASMLPPEQRPAAQLQRALSARPVYAMGVPGTSLLDYAERIRFAHERLGVRDFVLLMERFDVRQSFCGSGNISGPCLRHDTLAAATELQSPPGWWKRALRNSALAQYLFSQLKFDPARLWQQALKQARPVNAEQVGTPAAVAAQKPAAFEAQELERQAVVTRTFFQRIHAYRDGKLVIVLDSDRAAIERGDRTADAAREQFVAMAKAEGALLIDTEPLYREHVARSELKLEVGPYDAHLNPLAIGLAMGAAAQRLR